MTKHLLDVERGGEEPKSTKACRETSAFERPRREEDEMAWRLESAPVSSPVGMAHAREIGGLKPEPSSGNEQATTCHEKSPRVMDVFQDVAGRDLGVAGCDEIGMMDISLVDHQTLSTCHGRSCGIGLTTLGVITQPRRDAQEGTIAAADIEKPHPGRRRRREMANEVMQTAQSPSMGQGLRQILRQSRCALMTEGFIE